MITEEVKSPLPCYMMATTAIHLDVHKDPE